MTFLDWLLPHRRVEAAVREWRAQLRADLRGPKWDEVEQALGRPIPVVLKELYADWALLDQFDIAFRAPAWPEDDVMILNAWEPASRACCYPELDTIPGGSFAFASNDYGEPFFFTPGDGDDGDGPVFVRRHDRGQYDRVADTLREFRSWLSQGAADSR